MSEYNEFDSGDTPEWLQPTEDGGDQAPVGEVLAEINGTSFEDVYRAAYVAYANIVKRHDEPDHEFVENPDLIELEKKHVVDFLHRIGQPDVETTFELHDDVYNCNSLYDAICDFGIDTKPRTSQFGQLLNILQVLQSVTSAFLSPTARGSKGEMTTILLGEVHGNGKSAIRTELSSGFDSVDGKKAKVFFSENPDVFFFTEATLELVNIQAKQWCKDILSNATNILSITARQFIGANLRVEFEDPSPTHLTIKLHGSNVDPITKKNLIFFLNELSQMLFPQGFSTEWKWAVCLEEILVIPISELIQTQVSLSLPSLGIRPEHLQSLPALAPLDLFGVASFDELTAKIPGLADLSSGNLATTLDLRQFVGTIIGQLLGGQDKLSTVTLLDLIRDWAPLAFSFLTPLLSNDLSLSDLVSALLSLISLGRLIFARDFNNFTRFNIQCTSGQGFIFESDNVFRVDALFQALDSIIMQLTTVVGDYQATHTDAAAQ